MILKKLYPVSSDIIRKTIEFPSGKIISLGSAESCSPFYMITSKEELEFASKQRDVQLMNPNEKELVRYLESLPEVPTVNINVPQDEAKKFDVCEVEEGILYDELVKRGYRISKISGDQTTSSAMSKIADTALIQEYVRRHKQNPNIGRASGIELAENNLTDLASLSFEELRQLCAKLGYKGLRNKENI